MGRKPWFLSLLSLLLCFSFFVMPAGAAESRVIVSLGDSFSCGEGIEPFYGQDEEVSDKCRNPDWLAHRSEKCWPGMLTLPGVDGPMKDHRGENWFLAAASGAVTGNLFLLDEAEILAGETAQQEKKYSLGRVSGTALLPPQLDIFDELDALGLKADYVTVTIGGNDLEFPMIVELSLVGFLNALPGQTPEEESESLWEIAYVSRNIRERIRRVYTDIAARAGGQACILAVGYPPLLAKDCGHLFPGKTPDILNSAVSLLNRELQDIVDECCSEGMNIFYVSVEEAFQGHEAYSNEPGINPVIFGSRGQDLDDLKLGSNYSMHPNELGSGIYARCVQEAIDRLESEKTN